jgi:hypothetical protein
VSGLTNPLACEFTKLHNPVPTRRGFLNQAEVMRRGKFSKTQESAEALHSANRRGKGKTNRGPRLTPTGLLPQHPERDGTGGGNAQQHGTQAAAREQTESAHTSPQAQRRSRQRPEPRKQRRQERSTQHHAESENIPAIRGQDPGARACNRRQAHSNQKSPQEEPGKRKKTQIEEQYLRQGESTLTPRKNPSRGAVSPARGVKTHPLRLVWSPRVV